MQTSLKIVFAFVSAAAFCFAQGDAASNPGVGPDSPAQTAKANKPATLTKPGDKAAGGTKAYVIGPLDILTVKVWNNANLSGLVDVGADGMISMPLIGELKADGLTREELKQTLTERLSELINEPQVEVTVAKINSKKYFVYEAVGHPGEYPLLGPTTIMDALSSVGGFRDFAKTNKIYLLRTLPDHTTKKFLFNYKEVSQGKKMEQNIEIENGDRIFVPE